MNTSPHWHAISVGAVLSELRSRESGLSVEEVQERRRRDLKGAVPEIPTLPVLRLLLRQFLNPIIFILLFAAVVTFVVQDWVNFFVILGATLLNAAIGFFQEFKADKALANLRQLVQRQARVVRDGVVRNIPVEELVLGDIVMVQSGDRVPADVRVIRARECRVDESELTGEWLPVEKNSAVVKEAAALGDMRNMLFMSTVVTEGSAKGVVVARGADTQFGRLVRLVRDSSDQRTPLQVNVGKLGASLGWLVGLIAIMIVVVGALERQAIGELVVIAIAVAVAAIPEGLPASMSVALAVSMRRILATGGLVRKLLAAETLGSASVICTDKTGTLTEGVMRVTDMVVLDTNTDRPTERLLERIVILGNDALIENPEDPSQEWRVSGNPTERALLQAIINGRIDIARIRSQFPLVASLPFSSARKLRASFRSATAADDSPLLLCYVMGAPEQIIDRSTFMERDGTVSKLAHKDALFAKVDEYAKQGLRVLAVAWRELSDKQAIAGASDAELDAHVKELIFVGFVVLQDPIRGGVKESIALARRAGIRPVMVTGDHQLTAVSIARQLGFDVSEDSVISGRALGLLSERELEKRVERISVYARVSPQDKLKIVDAWHAHGAVVAMTGDGINDAPALKRADIGIALGSGTDVAKGVSDLVLLRNDFRTIVAAIRQGRIAFDNMQKIIVYLLANSLAEVVLVLGSLLLQLPVAILPAQILWVNIVDDGLPNFALAFEPGEPDIMKRKPRPRNRPLLDRSLKKVLAVISLTISLLLFGTYVYLTNHSYFSLAVNRSMMFAGVGLLSFVSVFSAKSLRRPLWRSRPFSNRPLLVSIAIGVLMICIGLYVPVIQGILNTAPLQAIHWAIIGLLMVLELIVMEGAKYLVRDRHYE